VGVVKAVGVVGLLLVAGAPAAGAPAERTLATLTFAPRVGKTTVKAWVTRKRLDDGGVVVRLVADGVGDKAQALTLYQGGGDDDGPSDDLLKAVKAQAFDLPDGEKAVRVDLRFLVPGSKNDFQTDTYLVGFAKKTHKLVELRTRLEHDRSKTCREVKETQLRFSADQPIRLEALTSTVLDPALGDDDSPIDKSCRGKTPEARVVYKLTDDHFVPVDPPPGKTAPAEPSQASDD
jgi:hypothetical protein